MSDLSAKMPPRSHPKTPENASLITLFTSLGLSSNAATELVRQPKSGLAFKSLVDEYHLEDRVFHEKQALALVKLSSSGGKLGAGERGYIVERIEDGGLKSPDQITGELTLVLRANR